MTFALFHSDGNVLFSIDLLNIYVRDFAIAGAASLIGTLSTRTEEEDGDVDRMRGTGTSTPSCEALQHP